MTLEQAKKIVDLMSEDGYEARVYENYSGRGMFGKSTTGIVCGDSSLVGYYAAKARVKVKDRPKRSDSLGRSIIVY